MGPRNGGRLNEYTGSDFDDFLRDEDVLEEVTVSRLLYRCPQSSGAGLGPTHGDKAIHNRVK